ncbi:hypothetical protein CAPTEDRAFT_91439, partial [Capitella teleta]
KTHVMHFTSSRPLPTSPVLIASNPIETEKSTMFLGIKIDPKLRWDQHIAMIKRKISKSIGAISKIKYLLEVSTLKTLYYAFVCPYLFYCIDVWRKAARCHLNSLIKAQKLCCRIILNAHPRSESSPTI